MRKFFTRIFLITILLLGALTACESNGSDADETVEPTTSTRDSATSIEETSTTETEPTDEPTEEAIEREATATEEPAEPTNELTPEVIETVDPSQIQLPNASDDGTFSFVVVDLFDNHTATNIPAAPEGSKLVMIRAAMTNQSDETITVTSGGLQAVDDQGNRYSAEAPAAGTQPSIVNAQIPAGEIFTGYAHFVLPNNSEVVGVEWCPTSECDQPLSMSLR